MLYSRPFTRTIDADVNFAPVQTCPDKDRRRRRARASAYLSTRRSRFRLKTRMASPSLIAISDRRANALTSLSFRAELDTRVNPSTNYPSRRILVIREISYGVRWFRSLFMIFVAVNFAWLERRSGGWFRARKNKDDNLFARLSRTVKTSQNVDLCVKSEKFTAVRRYAL